MPAPSDLEAALVIHEQAASSLLRVAEAVPANRWTAPLSEGKWTPAQLLEHLLMAYGVLIREMEGGEGMKVRTSWWQRAFLSIAVKPRLLAGAAFPKGARAPREVRPAEVSGGRDEHIERFRKRATEFAIAAGKAASGTKLTHAYFGQSTVAQGVLLCARHIDHHRAQLEEWLKEVDGAEVVSELPA